MMAARVAGHQVIDHRAGDARLHVPAVLLDHRGQPVLFGQLLAAGLFALEDAGADQRPVMIVSRIEQFVEIDRLMRAMEIADAEMQEAGLQLGAVVIWARDLGGERFQSGGG